MNQEIQHKLIELGLKNNEANVYLALTSLGEATATAVAKKADLPRTTALSILNKLAKDNYLTTHRYHGTTYFWVESPKTIASLLENKLTAANQLGDLLTGLYRSEAHFPFSQTYDTKTGIRKFIEWLLTSLPKKSLIFTIDTPEVGNYQKIYSDAASQSMIGIKNNRQISTHTLVPFNSYKKIGPEKLNRQNIIIREMPPTISFSASLWLVGDLLIHFSGNPPFITAIKHDKIVASLKNIYDYLWSVSTQKN